jgi:hypothetical protein
MLTAKELREEMDKRVVADVNLISIDADIVACKAKPVADQGAEAVALLGTHFPEETPKFYEAVVTAAVSNGKTVLPLARYDLVYGFRDAKYNEYQITFTEFKTSTARRDDLLERFSTLLTLAGFNVHYGYISW